MTDETDRRGEMFERIADDIRNGAPLHTPDLWPLVRNEVRRRNPGVVGLDLHALEEKWRAGAVEHGDDWTQWTDEEFTRQIDAERMDLMLYRAMWQVAVNQRHGGSEAPGGPT